MADDKTPTPAARSAVTGSPKTTIMGLVTALALAWLFVGKPMFDDDPNTHPQWEGLIGAFAAGGVGLAAVDKRQAQAVAKDEAGKVA